MIHSFPPLTLSTFPLAQINLLPQQIPICGSGKLTTNYANCQCPTGYFGVRCELYVELVLDGVGGNPPVVVEFPYNSHEFSTNDIIKFRLSSLVPKSNLHPDDLSFAVVIGDASYTERITFNQKLTLDNPLSYTFRLPTSPNTNLVHIYRQYSETAPRAPQHVLSISLPNAGPSDVCSRNYIEYSTSGCPNVVTAGADTICNPAATSNSNACLCSNSQPVDPVSACTELWDIPIAFTTASVPVVTPNQTLLIKCPAIVTNSLSPGDLVLNSVAKFGDSSNLSIYVSTASTTAQQTSPWCEVTIPSQVFSDGTVGNIEIYHQSTLKFSTSLSYYSTIAAAINVMKNHVGTYPQTRPSGSALANVRATFLQCSNLATPSLNRMPYYGVWECICIGGWIGRECDLRVSLEYVAVDDAPILFHQTFTTIRLQSHFTNYPNPTYSLLTRPQSASTDTIVAIDHLFSNQPGVEFNSHEFKSFSDLPASQITQSFFDGISTYPLPPTPISGDSQTLACGDTGFTTCTDLNTVRCCSTDCISGHNY